MSVLTDKQARFSTALGVLLVYAAELGKQMGYRLRHADAYRNAKYNKMVGGKLSSNHTMRLAQDFVVDRLISGKWVRQTKRTPYHEMLHRFWETIGGAKEIPNDAAHFSFEHNGMR